MVPHVTAECRFARELGFKVTDLHHQALAFLVMLLPEVNELRLINSTCFADVRSMVGVLTAMYNPRPAAPVIHFCFTSPTSGTVRIAKALATVILLRERSTVPALSATRQLYAGFRVADERETVRIERHTVPSVGIDRET